MTTLVRRPAGAVVELGDADRAELLALLANEPLTNAAIESRLTATPSWHRRQLGGTLWGVRDRDGTLGAAVFDGGIVQPVGGGPEHWRALGAHLGRRRRVCSSIVGAADAVHAMWAELEPAWGRARAIRPDQPLLTLDPHVLLPPGHPGLRNARPDDLAEYVVAATAMFTHELGAPPRARDYRERIAELIDHGRCLAVVGDHGRVDFKADIGAVSAHTCQVQGVWVRPELRGRGLGRAAMAGVLAHARRLAPSVSLYVNDFNHVARHLYARLGMRQVGTLATVLF